MPHISTRDGKRKKEPDHIIDRYGEKQYPPDLKDVTLTFEITRGSNRSTLTFSLEWKGSKEYHRGVRHIFHSVHELDPENSRQVKSLILSAAREFACMFYGQKSVQKNKPLEQRDIVKFLFNKWHKSRDWAPIIEESWALMAVEVVMES